jgi:hypothetical protein
MLRREAVLAVAFAAMVLSASPSAADAETTAKPGQTVQVPFGDSNVLSVCGEGPHAGPAGSSFDVSPEGAAVLQGEVPGVKAFKRGAADGTAVVSPSARPGTVIILSWAAFADGCFSINGSVTIVVTAPGASTGPDGGIVAGGAAPVQDPDNSQRENSSSDGGVSTALLIGLAALAGAGLVGFVAWGRHRHGSASKAELARTVPDDQPELDFSRALSDEDYERAENALKKRELYRQQLARYSYADLDRRVNPPEDGSYRYNGYEYPPKRADFTDQESYESAKHEWDYEYEIYKSDLLIEYERQGEGVDRDIAWDRAKADAQETAREIWEFPGRKSKEVYDAYQRWWSDLDSWVKDHSFEDRRPKR